jgi:hypothetical protein
MSAATVDAMAGLLVRRPGTSNTPAEALYPALILSGVALTNIFIPLQLAMFAGLGPQDIARRSAPSSVANRRRSATRTSRGSAR